MINKFYLSDAKVVDDRQGIVEAYVNTMGVRDSDGDIIDPAAFDASIRGNLPIPVLAGHDIDDHPNGTLNLSLIHI